MVPILRVLCTFTISMFVKGESVGHCGRPSLSFDRLKILKLPRARAQVHMRHVICEGANHWQDGY